MNISITYVANQLKLNEDQVSVVLNLLNEEQQFPLLLDIVKPWQAG